MHQFRLAHEHVRNGHPNYLILILKEKFKMKTLPGGVRMFLREFVVFHFFPFFHSYNIAVFKAEFLLSVSKTTLQGRCNLCEKFWICHFTFLVTNWYIDAATNSAETVEKQVRFLMPHTPLKTLRREVSRISWRKPSVMDQACDNVNRIPPLIQIPGAIKNQKLFRVIY